MGHRIAILAIVGVVVAGISSGAALADPPQNNGHNCSGFASTFVPEENLGESVRALAGAFPTAIPTLLDNANCGGNGFPPG
jgi:hypothetical protein